MDAEMEKAMYKPFLNKINGNVNEKTVIHHLEMGQIENGIKGLNKVLDNIEKKEFDEFDKFRVEEALILIKLMKGAFILEDI